MLLSYIKSAFVSFLFYYFRGYIATAVYGSKAVSLLTGWTGCKGLQGTDAVLCHLESGFSVLSSLPKIFFSNGKKSSSVCESYDKNGLCLVWTDIDSDLLDNKSSEDVSGYARSCIKAGGKSEVVSTKNGRKYECRGLI